MKNVIRPLIPSVILSEAKDLAKAYNQPSGRSFASLRMTLEIRVYGLTSIAIYNELGSRIGNNT